MSKRGLSMSRKLNSDSYLRKSKELPGPGQYNTLGNQLSRPGIKFNQQKKMFEYPVNMRTDPAIPGPAAYSEHAAANGKSCLAKYRNSSVCKFGSEKRTSRSSVSPTPSPLECTLLAQHRPARQDRFFVHQQSFPAQRASKLLRLQRKKGEA